MRAGRKFGQSWKRCSVAVLAVAGVVACAPATVSASEDAAHAIAEKFAGASREAEEQRAEAARKAAEAKAAEAARKKAEARRVEAERKAKLAKAREEAARKAAEEMRLYEKEMLSRARAEAEQRRAAAERERQEKLALEAARQAAEEARKAAAAREAESVARKAEVERHRQIQRLAREAEVRMSENEKRLEAQAREAVKERAAQQRATQNRLAGEDETETVTVSDSEIAETERLRLEAQRAAEAEALTQRLRRIRDSRRDVGRSNVKRDLPPPDDSQRDMSHSAAKESLPARDRNPVTQSLPTASRNSLGALPSGKSRVSILLVMKPGDRGIRRFNKSADPVICLGDKCYVSQGPNDQARIMRRRRVLGTTNTMGRRAWACVHKLVCVFRGVEFDGDTAQLQPIDLRIMRHDRRPARRIAPDPSCTVVDGHLGCSKTIDGSNWRAWIVPEGVAQAAGHRVLEKALADGLVVTQEARLER